MTENKRVRTLQNLGILTLALVSLFYMNELFNDQLVVFRTAVNSIVLPFGIALFISYLVDPIMKLLEKRFKIQPRIVTVIIVFIFMILVIVVFSYFVGITIYEQAVSFFQNDWEGIVVWFNALIENNPSLEEAYTSIQNYISFDNASPVIFNFVNIVRGIGSFVVVIVLIPVFLFFLLKEKETVFLGIVSVVPKKYKHHVTELGHRANEVIQNYFSGRFLVMFIMSIALTIMFMAFGFNVQRSIFFGFTLGFLDIIPYIGGFIGLLLPILYSFTIQDQLWLGEWTFVGLISVNAVIQLIQGNILQPIIMGREVNLHPLLVLTSFIFFGSLFGITGIILAIPITGIIKASASYFNELKTEEDVPKPEVPKSKPKAVPKKLSNKT